MKFKENDKIEIDNEIFSVSSVHKTKFTHTKTKKTYYTYALKSKNKNITQSSLDYISDNNLIFHLTKKVKSIIEKNKIFADSIYYEILSHETCIFMDYGEEKEVEEYKLKGNFDGIIPSELHILPDNTQILYLNKKIAICNINKK